MKIKHLLSKLLKVGWSLAATIILLSFGQNASAQWTPSGTNVYYNGGNVGIGTNNPTHPLVVGGGTTTGVNANITILSAGSSQSGVGAVVGQKAIYLFTDGSMRKLDAYNYGAGVALDIQLGGNGGNIIIPTGYVGIGTTNPDSHLTVSAPSTAVTSIQSTGTIGTTRSILQLINPGNSGNGWDFGYNLDLSSQNFTVRELTSGATATRLVIQKTTGYLGIGRNPSVALDVQGDIQASGNIRAKYQDVAEWVPASEQLPAGTVVVLDSTKSNQITSSTQSYDTRVAGVVSAQPGITLGESGAKKVLVATTGRVLVQVDAGRAPIHIGDLLVTSDVPGVAMKSEPVSLGGVQLHRPGTLIGKALEPMEKGSGKILVLLSLQ
jgi:hypothetical protein